MGGLMKLVVAAAHRKGLSWPLRNLLLPVAVLALIVIGWCSVYLQSRTIINANIAAYQQTQLEIVRAVARSIEAYLKLSIISPDPADIAAMEQEIFVHFVAPVHLLEQGDAWIYAPSHVVFDKSVDFPIEYQGKSMAEIFAMQRAHGASNYEEMAAAVMAAEEGVGWYIWQRADMDHRFINAATRNHGSDRGNQPDPGDHVAHRVRNIAGVTFIAGLGAQQSSA